jgi:hypothetical protein
MSTEIKPDAIRDQDEAISLSYWLAEQMGEHVDDQGDETLTETVQRYVSREWMPKTGANTTPAPLDPSKVKAGDTVTVHVKFENPEFRDFTITGEVYNAMEGAGLYVGGWPLLDHTQVTLTDHQPAPKPEWKPGTTGTATIAGKPGVRVMRVDPDDRTTQVMPWASDHMIGGWFFHTDETVTDFVADETRPLPSREAMAEAMHDDRLPGGQPRLTYLQRLILADAIIANQRGESR